MTKHTVAIIEPHFDDFWLNMGGFQLINDDYDYIVVSVSKDDSWNYVNHTKELGSILNGKLQTFALGYDSLPIEKEKLRAQLANMGTKNEEELFLRTNKLDSMGQLAEGINERVAGADYVFLPMGLHHPMHKVLSTLEIDKPCLKYGEYPYRFYPSERDNLSELESGMHKYELDVSDVVDKKLDIFKKIYTTQQYIFTVSKVNTPLTDATKEVFYSSSKIDSDLNIGS